MKNSALLLAGQVEDGSFDWDSVLAEGQGQIHRAPSCFETLLHLHREPPRVVVCEKHLEDGSWNDVLEFTLAVEDPPPVIVTSRFADDHLWVEVLNLGGYDVLAKPFDREEVRRTLALAWQHWASRRDSAWRRGRAGPVAVERLA